MVTVEVDPVRVESRLAAGEIGCPGYGGVLGGWGCMPVLEGSLGWPTRFGRGEPVAGRAVTHVLLPVTVLLRRAYAAEQIWAALTARADGSGHRRIAAVIQVPAATVRGWLRRAADRLEGVRNWFLGIAVVAGVDVAIPDGAGCPWRDVLVAVGTATTAIRFRFGAVGLLGAVTPGAVAVAASGGRLLAPGWPTACGATRITPDAAEG